MTTAFPLLDAEAARAGDDAAVRDGDTWDGLMERAAGHLARGVTSLAGHRYGLRVAVLVGKGNNGGDGWAAARRLRSLGSTAWVVAVHGIGTDASPETRDNRARWIDGNGRTSGPEGIHAALGWADIAVDALLGTGSRGAPRGVVADACAALRDARARGVPVVAADVPTGVDADDGSAADGAVAADVTVTFGAHKRGLWLHPGRVHAGRIVVGGLGPRYAPPSGDWRVLTAFGAAPPSLDPDADKRARGTVVVVAGSRSMPGAAVLTTRGALGAGAGLVTLAAVAEPLAAVAVAAPAATTLPLPAAADGGIGASAADVLAAAPAPEVVVAGPGLGRGAGAAEVVARLREQPATLVLDADALNLHRDDPRTLAEHAGALVLTPHQRELARIGGGDDGPDAWRRRARTVPELAERYDATIVAKGPGTLVAAPDGRVWVTPTGGPALGTGGSGDVLAGVIAAAVARADDIPLAVARACWLHGLAGDLAAEASGGRGGTDLVLAAIPVAQQRLRDLADSTPTWPLTEGAA